MPDIRLREAPPATPVTPPEAVNIDWVLTGEGIDESQALATAVIVALSTDGLAATSDPLPDKWFDNNRRGWWGDVDAATIWGGWPIGSRLWTMQRDKITFAGSRGGSTQAKAQNFCNLALQPFVDAGIISSFSAVATTPNSQKQINVNITLFRNVGPDVTLTYAFLWDEISRQTQTAAPLDRA